MPEIVHTLLPNADITKLALAVKQIMHSEMVHIIQRSVYSAMQPLRSKISALQNNVSEFETIVCNRQKQYVVVNGKRSYCGKWTRKRRSF